VFITVFFTSSLTTITHLTAGPGGLLHGYVLRCFPVILRFSCIYVVGEQSVGKSFALNHFVDTSFAGSAMRTTEGVWMSVNPTEDALIVALDFEGVHSIERSAQEDTLLVLFNTAISNLVCAFNQLNWVAHEPIFRSSSETTSRCLEILLVYSNLSSHHRQC
jgi:hypothetical protein